MVKWWAEVAMTTKSLPSLLDKMWKDYVAINPLAQKIHDLLTARGDKLLNDHIALRTFNHPRVGVDVLAAPFVAAGYWYGGDYHFKEKKLYAKHYQHDDPTLPKIFISELKLEECSPVLNSAVEKMIAQIPAGMETEYDFCSMGRPWDAKLGLYRELLAESDYAAWVAAFGYRPNHFTVFVNALKSFPDLQALNAFLKSQGIKLNESGGEIKGTPAQYLEQSSTLANNIEVAFNDGNLVIPACYYEFARRHAMPDGKLYQGFVAASADKIFESTSRGQ
jgi:hypothetical protein